MTAARTRTIAVLGGDGIGPEVTDAALRVLEAMRLQLRFCEAEVGYACHQRHGSALPEATVAAVAAADATLFGAVTTPPGIPGYRSPIVELRRRFELYANVRPVRSLAYPTSPSSRPGIDLVIVRENTEGLYAGRERLEDGGETAIAERVITRAASERLIRFAFELARRRGPGTRLTLVHKANILRETCGLFRRVGLELASSYPEVDCEEMLVDTCALRLVQAPESFQVIATTNLFGDILSDVAAALCGGLGVVCSANIGKQQAVFEPVHGSAPDIAGQGKANPVAALLSAALMLEHLGLGGEASRLRQAVDRTLERGETTPDLGGKRTTVEVVAHVIAGLGA